MISRNSLANFTTCTQIIDDLGNFLSQYDLELDSRRVNSNSIFCAYPGSANDGRNYIESVIANGAKAILYEPGINLKTSIKHIAVENLIYYVGLFAAAKYNNPSKKFNTIGVTGTNGKTSVTHWLNQIYTMLKIKSAIIGTTGAGIYPDIIDYASTTPDPITLQKLLADFAKQKVDVLAMEVSSHSLHQGRVNGVAFKTAVFTNLSQDHLDYHKTMESYYQAKRDLFYWHDLEHAVINVDDEYGQRLVNELSSPAAGISPPTTSMSSPTTIGDPPKCHPRAGGDLPLSILTYGIDSGDLRATNLSITLSGMSFKLSYNPDPRDKPENDRGSVISAQAVIPANTRVWEAGIQEYEVTVKVIGRFNVYNILAAVGTLVNNGHKLSQIIPQLLILDL